MAPSIFEQAFGTANVDLYKDVLLVPKDCSPAQLRKGYYKQALKFHPDKNKGTNAKLKFQAISLAYSLLKDPKKREDYDNDGIIPHEDDDIDDGNEKANKSWKAYFDLIFGKLSTEKIDSFAQKYKMSDEEERDVMENYVKFKGNLKKMLEFVMLSEERDVSRWLEDYIQPAIERNEVENFKSMLEKTKAQIDKKLVQERKKSAVQEMVNDDDETETEESECGDDEPKQRKGRKTKRKLEKKNIPHKAKSTALRKKSKVKNSEEDLISAIRNKNGRGNPLASIAARYGVSPTTEDPLDDEKFERLRSKYSKK